jgi:tetratricopeptide (TPR) repeat protein/DNA-binding winged helix-turn-helix (wHTH) protein
MIGREPVAAQLADLIRAHPVVAVFGPLGIGKTELVRWVVEREAAAGRVPAPAYASLADVDGAREILERTCRALARKYPPVESSRLVPALCALFTSAACTLVWDDAQDAPLEALAATLVALPPRDGVARSCRIVIVARDSIVSNQAALHAWAERNGIASLEVPPLDAAACRHLLEALEHRRERSLQDEAIFASGGNPLALQLAIAATSTAGSDPMVVLGHAIDALTPDARAVLFLLFAAEAALRDADLRAVCGSGTSRTLLLLERHALVVRDGDRVSLPPPMMAPVRSLIGPPQPATWEALEALARRALAGAPDDSEALLLACRALAHRGRAPEALALLRGHVAARAAASPAALERTFGDMARGDPAAAPDSVLALAREQLRWGDFEAARRTLSGLAALELPAPLVYRRCILSAEALVRAGEPASATHELEHARLVMPPGAEIALEEGLADLATLRGDLHGARRALLRLARRTRAIPSLEGRRALSLGFSYLLEERHDRALAWARKARHAYRRRGDAAVDILVPIVEIAALMGLDQIDRATEVVARETAVRTCRDDRGIGQGTAILFQAGVLFRRGELEKALHVGEPAFRTLDRRADRIFRGRVAHYLARSAIGLGQFERAEEFIRIAAGIAAEPGLGVLRPTCEMDFALLCEARGDRKEAADRSRRALSGRWRSPLAQVDAWALDDRDLPPPRAGFGAAQAYTSLRSAERALERGDLAQADAAAGRAEGWYRRAGALYELARAHLVRGEARARLGQPDESSSAIAGCVSLSEKNGYLPLLLCAHLLRAFLAERAGDVEGCAAELESAWNRATRELREEALLRACSRAGVPTDGGATGPARPLASRIARLGLDRPARFVTEEGERRWILDAGEEAPGRFDLTMVVDSGRVRSDHAELPLPPQRLQILEQLACNRATGVSLQDLHLKVWGGTEYHPLRHRNAVYVALTRLRESLGALLERDAFVEGPDGRYRITPGVRVAVQRSCMGSEADSQPRAASAK